MLPEHIVIDADGGRAVRAFFRKHAYTKVVVVTDQNTNSVCYPAISAALPAHEKIVIEPGEEQKTIETCMVIWNELTRCQLDRHSVVVLLGGGVIGDMGGFCAATYKRGIDFVLMPTTLLSQADASVGGKLGVDFHHYKNHIGVFQEPTATLVITSFLNTLPVRELRSGFAEVIKHCIISDVASWKKVSALPLDDQPWVDLIPQSVAFKYDVIKQDPREKGLRKILNFGHTVGHAIESYLLEAGNRIFHGEAVAVGMIAEAQIANAKGMVSADELKEISSYIISVFGKIDIPSAAAIMPVMFQDKKNRANQILMALPKGIGSAVWDVVVSQSEIEASLNFYNAL